MSSSAKMVDFHNWKMPLHYGSQIKEHEIVRNSCGIFDVSHMYIFDIEGNEAKSFLRTLLSNDVASLENDFDSFYSAMLNEIGGVIDDLIAYKMRDGFRIVANCATGKSDLEWINKNLPNKKVEIKQRKDLSIISIQGPKSFEILSSCLSSKILNELNSKKSFQGSIDGDILVTKTGYTGEIGVEAILPHEKAKVLWSKAVGVGAYPIGLGARDTLRLEAGMNLYGSEMNQNTSPLECNMSWVVSLKDRERDFIGKEPYLKKKQEVGFPVLKGLVFKEKSIVRPNQRIYFKEDREKEGIVTSGSYSPTLKKSIALARIPPSNQKNCLAEVRGKIVSALIGEPRFVKEGKVVFKEKAL